MRSIAAAPHIVWAVLFIIAPLIFVMSPKCSISGKCRLVMEIGRASISLAHTGSMPQCTAANGNTPIPSNRLPSLSAVTRIPRAAHRAVDTAVAGADFLAAYTGKAVTMLVRV